MPKCLVVQHVAPESSFLIGDALSDAGVEVETRPVFDGAEVPRITDGLDGLVVMGGPMSAGADDGFPTRTAEIALIAEALDRGIPTLGVCLGAQLLAVAAGGAVMPGALGPEVGWGPVDLTPACREDRLFTGLPATFTVMHWHGDTVALPDRAERLIGNSNYPNQGFRIGEWAWGVQFHLEVTEAAVEGFVAAFASDAERARGGPPAILAATPGAIAELSGSSALVFGRFADLVAARVAHGDLVDMS
jgi:GMP synthase-like glutamine amidotransferase